MSHNTVYQVGVVCQGTDKYTRIWIDRTGRKKLTLYDASATVERAKHIEKHLPSGGILTEYEDGFSWALPNFGRDLT